MSIPSINPHVWMPITDRTLIDYYGTRQPIWEVISKGGTRSAMYSIDTESGAFTHYRLLSFGEVAPPPKPKTREDLDRDAFAAYWNTTGNAQYVNGHDARPIYIDGLKDGRIESRKALAKQVKETFAAYPYRMPEALVELLQEAAQ